MGTHTSPPPDWPARAVFDHLRRLVQALRTGARQSRDTSGISTAQLFVLSRLQESGESTINALAARTMTHQSSVSEILSKLEQARLVRRRPGKEDRRAVLVKITALGARRVAGAPELVQTELLRGLEKLEPAEVRELAGLLGKWVQAAGLAHEEPAMFFEPSAPSQKNRSDS